MPSLDDPRWRSLAGAYGTPYDAAPALRRLATDWRAGAAWSELWSELHHQGDVGEASYAAVAALVEIGGRMPERGWNFYALAATIESERHARRNRPVPAWLAPEYARAWSDLLGLALDELRVTEDPLVVRSALAVVALAKGATRLGVMLGSLDASELDRILEDAASWSEQYRDDGGVPTAVAGQAKP